EGAPVPVQRVLEPWVFELARHDYSDRSDGLDQALQHLRRAYARPFQTYGLPLWEMQWVQATATRGYCLCRFHHLAIDGSAVAIVLNELTHIYNRLLHGQLPDLPAAPSYLAHLADEDSYRASQRFAGDRQFWLDRFSRVAQPLWPRPPSRVLRQPTQQLLWEIPRQRYVQLDTTAQALGGSLAHLLILGFAQYFARLEPGCKQVAVGMAAHNRRNADERRTVGLFATQLPLHVAVDPRRSLRQAVADLSAQLRSAYRHQRFSMQELARQVQAHAGRPSRLIDFSVSAENFPGDFDMTGGQLFMQPQHNGFEDVPLALYLRDYRQATDPFVELNFDPQVLSREQLQSALGFMQRLLDWVLQCPDTALGQLPLLPETEQAQLLAFNATEAAFDTELCIHQLFEQQARLRPEAIALVFEHEQLSYAALNARANQLAHHLLSLGVLPDTRVAICLPRSTEMVVALLATLKAGAAYVPLDPAYPAHRLAFMLEDSSPLVLLTDAEGQRALPALSGMRVCRLDAPAWDDAPASKPAVPGLNPLHLAYVIYTSGSTGTPKGVQVSHHNLVCYVQFGMPAYGIQASDRVPQGGALSFDMAAEEVFLTLSAGATLVLLPWPTLPSIADYTQFLNRQQISRLVLPTAYWHEWTAALARGDQAAPASVEGVVVGGEQASLQHCRQWSNLVGQRISWLNTYGPTEATVIVAAGGFGQHDRQPDIGRPLPHSRIYILDAHGQLAPVGVAGELHIAGAQLARGYLNRAELTAERFVPDPFGVPGSRMYRSGDLARWSADGSLDFLGRNDHQVKIRGFRIELGEIEAALQACPGVRESVVLARQDGEHQRLVAYLVADTSVPDSLSAEALSPEALRTQLSTRLPEYMLPAAYVRLPALPLTPNGKLDRQALPEPDASALGSSAYEPPQGPVEETLAALWCELLGLAQVGRHDDFFALGGHSLLAVQLASRVRSSLGLEVALADLFAHPRLADFALALA
ncbi:MAG: amino acid adenylation domain-containing protein, partial [Burkholderiales bacterium]|nr:amino acid adenylation domain-containing protein [Burkholderiales bacterium]